MPRNTFAPRSLAILALGSAAMIASSASAQSLSDRIDHVMQQRSRAQANNQSKAKLLSTLLYTDVSVQFNQTPLRDVMKYLETVLGVNLACRYSDDRNSNGSGMDPDAPITLSTENAPAINVVEMVLSQLSDGDPATWQLRDGYIEIGTKERLSVPNARELRYYPIRDLLFQPPNFDNAPKLDLDAALNQGQQSGTGGGGGGGFGGGGGGGGGAGGGGSGTGGSIFGEAGDDPTRLTEAEQAQAIMDLITETVEPEAWETNGGEYATIRYYQGTLIIRAPDYIQRQINGYPFATRPVNASAMHTPGSRYVTFTGALSDVKIAGVKVSPPFTGSAGGSTGATTPDGKTAASATSGSTPKSGSKTKP